VTALGRKPQPNRPPKGGSQNVGLPDKLDAEPFNRLRMPCRIHGIPFNPTTLGVYATPKANTLMLLFLVLFSLIFKASKA